MTLFTFTSLYCDSSGEHVCKAIRTGDWTEVSAWELSEWAKSLKSVPEDEGHRHLYGVIEGVRRPDGMSYAGLVDIIRKSWIFGRVFESIHLSALTHLDLDAAAALATVLKSKGCPEADVSAALVRGIAYGIYALHVDANGKVNPLGREEAEAGVVAITERRLEMGLIAELPAGFKAEPANVEDENEPTAVEDEEEPEPDTWGLRLRTADDIASRYDCRVEVSGKDDARNPNSYYDGLRDFVVVTERSSGRVVGLVDAWETDDGDPVVPRTWLKAILLAWRDQGTPKKAAV